MEEVINSEILNNALAGLSDTGISNDMFSDSMSQLHDFFNLDTQMTLDQIEKTVMDWDGAESVIHNLWSFDISQLNDLGIANQDALNLIMTHDMTDFALQSQDVEFNTFQRELCGDFMTGVRAGIDNIDISQLENSIQDNNLDQISGRYHIEAIEQGVKFAHEYMAAHDATPSFDDCLDNFNNGSLQNMAELAGMEHDLYIEECNMEHYRQMLENDPDNVTARQQYNESELRYSELRQEYEQKESLIHDNNHIKGTYNPTFGYKDNYYTKSEIEAKKQTALQEYHRQQNRIEDISGKINHEAHLKQPSKARLDSLRSDLQAAQRKMEDARSEYNAWCYTKSKD